jgi:hypothetical protein
MATQYSELHPAYDLYEVHRPTQESIDDDDPPPPYADNVPPPPNYLPNAVTATLTTDVLFQGQATFFTRVTTTFPARTLLAVTGRTATYGHTMHKITEPMRLSRVATFDDLQSSLRVELERRQISTQLPRGLKFAGRLRAVHRDYERKLSGVIGLLARNRAVWSVKIVRLKTEVDVENWEEVLGALWSQKLRGLELIVWPELIWESDSGI